MNNLGKHLSNPFSTGGGGSHFEANVQAAFTVLMLTGGFAPCLPCWPIRKIKLQGKYAGYDTDDMVIFVEKDDNSSGCKILCQIKHSVTINEKDKEFAEVIQCAWNDFNNSSLFSKGKDYIVLITGPLSATDINDGRTILEWAKFSENANDFFTKVERANFSSQKKQKKLQAFRMCLRKANGNIPVSNEILFEFLKHFHLLIYDLDIRAGVTLSLLHSLIGQYTHENIESFWSRIVNEVQTANKNAGTLSLDNLPDDLLTAFKQKVYEIIPKEFTSINVQSTEKNWSKHSNASDIVIANLLGAWNERNVSDIEVVQKLANKEYSLWISSIREFLNHPSSPVVLKNEKWRITERKEIWKELGTRIFDSDLDKFRQCIAAVLSEQDPKFDLPPEDRFAASIHGKVLKHSSELRKGMAESLALLSSQQGVLVNCSQNWPETVAILSVREILNTVDWKLWGSLDQLLPILAEAAPDEFLRSVEHAMQQSPCPFTILFSQKSNTIFDTNYLTGLLWGLEALAWDEKYLVRVCAILGDLVKYDQGGNSLNRPANSLKTILLPWLPQTTAPFEKRKAVLRTLQKESPAVAWKLLVDLLPNQQQSSGGSYKPQWRGTVPDEEKKGVTRQEYLEQVSYYAELAVSMAFHNIERLNELIKHFDNLTRPAFEKALEHLSSESITCLPEEDRLVLWNSLSEFILKYKRSHKEEWALNNELVSKMEGVAAKLAPSNPVNLHRRLFGSRDIDLYEERRNLKEQAQKLERQRQGAINEILNFGGMDAIIFFVELVDSPSRVGYSLSITNVSKFDEIILPTKLDSENKKLSQFVSGYIWGRYEKHGWAWVDGLNISGWPTRQIGLFLSYLPFTDETWSRVCKWLDEAESEYWVKANVNPYQSKGDLIVAIDKLIKYGRPCAAIDCIYANLEKQPLDKQRSVTALLAAVSSEESQKEMIRYNAVEIIKALQNDPTTDPDNLISVEWAYLPLLDRVNEAFPKGLERKLASDAEFFCEIIQLLYRSRNNGNPRKEPTKTEKRIAQNAMKLLFEWRTPPGTQSEDCFSSQKFLEWLDCVKEICTKSGHLEVALTHVGQVLIYCPPDPQGLWIHQTVAEALNTKDTEEMRNGFSIALSNSRGVHWVDPTGKPERELAEQYKKKAEDVEDAGYHRLATTLKGLAEDLDREAVRIVVEHNNGEEADSN